MGAFNNVFEKYFRVVIGARMAHGDGMPAARHRRTARRVGAFCCNDGRNSSPFGTHYGQHSGDTSTDNQNICFNMTYF